MILRVEKRSRKRKREGERDKETCVFSTLFQFMTNASDNWKRHKEFRGKSTWLIIFFTPFLLSLSSFLLLKWRARDAFFPRRQGLRITWNTNVIFPSVGFSLRSFNLISTTGPAVAIRPCLISYPIELKRWQTRYVEKSWRDFLPCEL